ncbi:MAG: hypothetical protein V1926_04505 [Candidatus Peregrinibacteria bacterium]
MHYTSGIAGVLALIPARSGSKSVKDKNIRLFAGKPLMVHSIEQARSSTLVDRILVSTDSEQYAEIARGAGAEVPFLRPSELAQDSSTDLEVFLHALQWLKDTENFVPELCVHLRPTHPIRRTEDIDRAIRLLQENPGLDSVRTVSPVRFTPFKMWLMQDDHRLLPAVVSAIKDAYNLPRQLLPDAYMQNACIDVVRTAVILEKRSMTGDSIYGYRMDDHFDIDTEEELRRAEHHVRSCACAQTPQQPGKKRTFCFDIDGVIAELVPGNDYSLAEPRHRTIALIRKLYDAGHHIVLATARGSMTGIDWRETTERQMRAWNVPYHELHFGKPAADVYVDDLAVLPDSLPAVVSSLVP